MAYLENREYPDEMPITSVMFHNINYLAHWHTEIEFLRVYEGRINVGVNSGNHVLEAGDMAMFSSGDIHYYDSRDSDSDVLIIVFRPEMISSVVDLAAIPDLSNILLTRAASSPYQADEAMRARMTDCFDIIHAEISQKKAAYQIITKGRLAEMAGLFLRLQPDAAAEAASQLGHGSKKLLQKAIRYINENFANDLSLEDVSGYLKISPFYFSRIFSLTTGMTYKRYLNSLRIEKASQQILSTTRPITDIAYECGFNSIRTFNRVFLEIRGVVPSSLRQITDRTTDR